MYQLKTSRIRQAGVWLSEVMLATVVIGVAATIVILLGLTTLSDQYTNNAIDTVTGVYSASTDYANDNGLSTLPSGIGTAPDPYWSTLANGAYLQSNFLTGCTGTPGSYTACTKFSPFGGQVTFQLVPSGATSANATGLQLVMPTASIPECQKLVLKFAKGNSAATCGTPAAASFRFVIAGTGSAY